jgi:hypothetical protein
MERMTSNVGNGSVNPSLHMTQLTRKKCRTEKLVLCGDLSILVKLWLHNSQNICCAAMYWYFGHRLLSSKGHHSYCYNGVLVGVDIFSITKKLMYHNSMQLELLVVSCGLIIDSRMERNE